MSLLRMCNSHADNRLLLKQAQSATSHTPAHTPGNTHQRSKRGPASDAGASIARQVYCRRCRNIGKCHKGNHCVVTPNAGKKAYRLGARSSSGSTGRGSGRRDRSNGQDWPNSRHREKVRGRSPSRWPRSASPASEDARSAAPKKNHKTMCRALLQHT